MRHHPIIIAVVLSLAIAAGVMAAPELRSGPAAGERVLPFTSNLVTGPYRGQQHCYVCELNDEPAVLVFARRMDPATGHLLRGLQETVTANRERKLFGWFVFLGEDGAAAETALEAAAYRFAQASDAAALPVSVLGDPHGPPGFRIAPEAAVTVLVFRNRQVLANRAFPASAWNGAAAAALLEELPSLLPR